MSEETNQPRNTYALFKKLGSDEVFTLDLESLLTSSYNVDKDSVLSALNNNDIATQRNYSMYFYSYSGVYRQLIHKTASMHYYRNIVSPQFYLSKNNKFNEKIDKEVMKYHDNCKVENTCYNIGLLAILYGACNTYETVTSDGQVVQQILPAEYCRTRSKDEFGNNLVEFNFQYFDNVMNMVNQDEQKNIWKTLPKEFEKLYTKNYKANKSNCNDSRQPQWQRLDSNFARCTMATISGSPLFANMFPDILDYEDYKAIDSTKAKQKMFKLIVQKFELNDEGAPVPEDKTIIDADSNLKKRVDGISCSVTTPFDIRSVSLDDKSTSQDIQYAEQSMNNLYNSSGTQQSVMGSLAGSGANAINSSNTLISASLNYIVYQYENWYIKKLNEISKGKVMYGFKILDITVFNEEKSINKYKQQLDTSGSVLLYASAIGVGQTMYKSLIEYENSLGIKDFMKPILNSNQTSSSDISNVGTNKKDISDKSDETIRTDDSRS